MNEEQNIIEKALPRTIHINGKSFLGIPTGISGSSFMLTKMSNLKHLPGWLVHGEEITEWKFSGFTKTGEENFIYGPDEKGILLAALFDRSAGEILPFLVRLVTAILKLKERGIPLFRIYTHSVLFLHEGGILFFPPDIMREITDIRNQEEKIHLKTLINHPDIHVEQSIAFFMAVILYRVLTETYPFYASREEEIHNQMRNLVAASPLEKVPSVREDVYHMVMGTLNSKSETPRSLDDWETHLKIWLKEGLERTISEDERKTIIGQAKTKKVRDAASYRRKVFWQKNFGIILGIGIITVVVGLLLWTIVYNVFFKSRATRGMSPVEVVRTYYKSINALDPVTLGDCVVGDAGKEEVDVVTNLYVITRQRMAYESTSFFISAEEWDRKGRPELQPYTLLFGVTQPNITEMHGEPDPVFHARYEYWNTEAVETEGQEGNAQLLYYGKKVEEKLSLRKDRGDWVIFKIEKLEETLLGIM
jgi:CRISPR/Cas system CMR-associated protein Cmr5 small subunit